MSSSTKLLTKYIDGVVCQAASSTKKLWVFDFDDTLVKTDARVHVTEPDGSRFDLTPGEFATYDKKPGQVFDYADFKKLINPRTIKWTNRILHKVHAHHGSESVVILSARSTARPIQDFFTSTDLCDIEVIALDSADPQAKARWVSDRITRDDIKIVEFFDDSYKNVAAIRDLQQHHPNVSILARHIVHTRIASLHS